MDSDRKPWLLRNPAIFLPSEETSFFGGNDSSPAFPPGPISEKVGPSEASKTPSTSSTILLQLPPEAIDPIFAGLQSLPWRIANPVISLLLEQIPRKD